MICELCRWDDGGKARLTPLVDPARDRKYGKIPAAIR
jgi:hypothetical protein